MSEWRSVTQGGGAHRGGDDADDEKDCIFPTVEADAAGGGVAVEEAKGREWLAARR